MSVSAIKTAVSVVDLEISLRMIDVAAARPARGKSRIADAPRIREEA